MQRIPFNRPVLVGREFEYIRESLANMHLSGAGPFSKKCEKLLEQELGVKRALLTTSCTHALEMAALLLNVGPGDEVILPSFTFVSTANAFVLRGAVPRFIDIRPDTLNLDETKLEAMITPRTAAILPVHYAGVACEMDAIMAIAERHDVPVIEDNAHGLFAKWRGKYLGTFGALATQSFHETKNFTCGEGGALLINDASFESRAEIIREKGTDRSRFFRGQVDKYTWVDLGSSYPLSDLLAAFLFAQLEQRDEILRRRRTAWQYYMDHLGGWASDQGARLPYIPPECEHSYHLFYVIMPSEQARDALIAHLNAQGINSVFHYQPLHLSAMGRQLGGPDVRCPVAEHAGDRLIRLPLFNSGEEYFVRTVEAVKSFAVPAGSLRNTCSA